MIVLDTNVISELARQAPDPGVLSWLDALEASDVATTAITAAELRYGIARLPDGHRKRELIRVISSILTEDFHGRVLPFDERASVQYADIVTGRERVGRPIGVADAQIAAICRDLGAILATRNTADFEETGIELIDPWKHGRSRGPGERGDSGSVARHVIGGREVVAAGQDRGVTELKERLRADMTEALRARDQVRLRTLRMAIASITTEEVSGTAHELSDADVIKVLNREAKKRREAAAAFEAAGRTDQAEAERAEGDVLAGYLPAQLSDDELAGLVAAAITETGAAGLPGLGKVMKAVTPQVAGRADGSRVAAEVRRQLSA